MRIQSSQHAVLLFLIKNYGGSSILAKDMGFNPQIFTNWAKRGVSVKHVVEVADHLKVSAYILNYRLLLGHELANKTYKQLIKECSKLTVQQKKVASDLDSRGSGRIGNSRRSISENRSK